MLTTTLTHKDLQVLEETFATKQKIRRLRFEVDKAECDFSLKGEAVVERDLKVNGLRAEIIETLAQAYLDAIEKILA